MSNGTPRQWRRRPGAGAAALCLGLAATAGCLALGSARDSWRTVSGDEGTYLAMTASLALDGDLRFDKRDRARLQAASAGGRRTVILQAAGGELAYSKPALHPLLAAPLYRVSGEAGLVVLNAAALALALVAAWLALRRLGGGDQAALALTTFAGASVLPGYLAWRTSDGLQASLSLAGLALALAPLGLRRETSLAAGPAPGPAERGRHALGGLDGHGAALLGGLLLGAAAALRLPNGFVLVGALAALAVAGQRGRALVTLAAALLVLALSAALGIALQGGANPYRAVRASFDARTGYPTRADEPLATERFAVGRATQTMGWLPAWRPALSAYSALYFVIGRHTGLLAYFPALLALALPLARSRDRARWMLVAAAGATALFYVVWWPENYFGGSTFLGNRYFLTAYPLLLFALPRLPGWRGLTAAWVLAAGLLASAWVSVLRSVEVERERQSQSHAYAGIFRLLPFESTALHIDGVRDLHWYGDVVRLVDPFARLRRTTDGDQLVAIGGRPAELLFVTRPEVRSVLFHSMRAEGRREPGLRVSGPLVGLQWLAGGDVLELSLPPAWRRHPFAGAPDRPAAMRTVRLRTLRGGVPPPHDSSGRSAQLVYGGDARLRHGAFVRDYVKVRLPKRAVSETHTSLPVEVRNMSPYPWFHETPFAVRLGYRWVYLRDTPRPYPLVSDEGGPDWRPYQHQQLQPIPAKVESGDPLSMPLEIAWPRVERPARILLDVDLYMQDFGWFAERVGAPLAEGIVEVVPPPRAAAPGGRP